MNEEKIKMADEAKPQWFSTGFDEVDRVQAAQKSRRSVFDRFALRFDQDKQRGEEATVAFLDYDDEKKLTGFWEHEYTTLDGAWYNHSLCSKGNPNLPACLLCERRSIPYFAGAFSVIRMSAFHDKQGKEYINTKQLVIAKTESLQRIRRMLQTRQGLVGTVWSVARTSFRAAKIGDDWQFLKKIDGGLDGIAKELKLTPEQVKPYDYAADLTLKSREQLTSEPIDWAKTTEKKFGNDKAGGDRSSGGSGGGGGGGGSPARGTEVPYGR